MESLKKIEVKPSDVTIDGNTATVEGATLLGETGGTRLEKKSGEWYLGPRQLVAGQRSDHLAFSADRPRPRTDSCDLQRLEPTSLPRQPTARAHPSARP